MKMIGKYRIISIPSLPLASNVCRQRLREVIELPNAMSIAYVEMLANAESLLHKHQNFMEIYYILQGEGVIEIGGMSTWAVKDSIFQILPNTPHKLKTIGDSSLAHLVISVPGFNAGDVILEKDFDGREEFLNKGLMKTRAALPAIQALDGASVCELITAKENIGIGIAVGELMPGKEARAHRHKLTDEIYFIAKCDEHGATVRLDDRIYSIMQGDAIYVPKTTIHGLSNQTENPLEVLCISTPAYCENDFMPIK